MSEPSREDATAPNPAAMAGWVGVEGEAAWRCIYCGRAVSEASGPLVRQAKKRHRESCPTVKWGVPEPLTRASVKVVLRQTEVRRVPYRLARWAWHVSCWFAWMGEWLDKAAER